MAFFAYYDCFCTVVVCFFFVFNKKLNTNFTNILVDKDKSVYIEGVRQNYLENYRDLPEFDRVFNDANDYYNNLKSLNKSSNELLESARQEALSGNFLRAEDLANRAKIVKTIEDSYDYYQLGVIYEAILKYDSAISCYKTALHLSPDNSTYQFHLSNTFGAIGEYETAISYIENALENGKRKGTPNLYEYYYSYANSLLYLGQLDKSFTAVSNAINEIEKINNKDLETKSRYLSFLGLLYADKGDSENAFKYCQQAIALLVNRKNSPELATAYHNYALIIWQNARREFPNKFDSRNDTLFIYLNDAKRYVKMSLDIEENFTKNDNQLEYDLGLAYSFNLLSMIYYKDGFNANPIAFDSAIVYGKKSITHLEKLLPKCHPVLGSAYSNLGMNYYGINDFINANKYHDNAIETIRCTGDTLNPYLASAYHNKAKVALKTKDLKLAEKLVVKAINIYSIEYEHGGDDFFLNDSKSLLEKIRKERLQGHKK